MAPACVAVVGLLLWGYLVDCVAFRFTGAAGFMIDELANGEARRPYTAPGAAFALKDSTPDDGWRPLVAFLTWCGARAETMPVFYVDAANMIENGLRPQVHVRVCVLTSRVTPAGRRDALRRAAGGDDAGARAARLFLLSVAANEAYCLLLGRATGKPADYPRGIRGGAATRSSCRHPSRALFFSRSRRPRTIRAASAAVPRPVPADYPRGIRGGAATRPRGLSARHPRRCRDPPLLSPTRRPDPHRRVF